MKCIKCLSGHGYLLFRVVEQCQKENASIEDAYEYYETKAINRAFVPLTRSTFRHYWNTVTVENRIQKRLHSIFDGHVAENEATPLNDTSYEKPVQPESDRTEMQHKQKLKFHIEISLSVGFPLELYSLTPNENYLQRRD